MTKGVEVYTQLELNRFSISAYCEEITLDWNFCSEEMRFFRNVSDYSVLVSISHSPKQATLRIVRTRFQRQISFRGETHHMLPHQRVYGYSKTSDFMTENRYLDSIIGSFHRVI
jgi:hypothetical protein